MTRSPGANGDGPLSAYDLDSLRERRSVKWATYPPDVLPMWVAEMDTPLAEPIASALTAAIRRGDTGYAAAGRLPEVYAEFASRRYGWRPDPAGMRLVADVMSGVVEAMLLTTTRGDRVVVNTPAYPPFFVWLDRIGRHIVESPLALGESGYRLDFDRLERDFAAGAEAYLLCSPHNPTGLVFGEEELATVAGLADRYGVRVIADEIHAPLTYPEARHVPFASLDTAASARAITLVSATKAWNLPGLKTALAVPGPETPTELARIPEEVSVRAGLLGVLASEAAFAEGEPWLAGLMAGLDANRRLLGEALVDKVPAIRWYRPQATYLAWLDCRALALGADPAEVFLERGRVALSPGPRFGAAGQGFARLNFATAPERVAEAVDRIAAALQTTEFPRNVPNDGGLGDRKRG
ncbi:MalY/PatB family protein [Amycolatopsis pigmentata]|uniref:cysteine-S-conjugate beta-lyase n=1 Tax=Amycolatopsis pigmentata TaxID=450801 RepID=A0ABW5FYL2_9PSEU